MIAHRDKGRVFVGVDRSLASLRALREAAAQARQRGAELHVVHVRHRERPHRPPMSGFYATAGQVWDPERSKWLDNAAAALIARCLDEALGGAPVDLEVHRTVLVGCPHSELVSLGRRDDDLLVVGTCAGRRWRHPWRRSVSRYCVVRARCPVLVVPRNEFARAAQRRVRVGWSRLPRDPWGDFDATVARETHPTR